MKNQIHLKHSKHSIHMTYKHLLQILIVKICNHSIYIQFFYHQQT